MKHKPTMRIYRTLITAITALATLPLAAYEITVTPGTLAEQSAILANISDNTLVMKGNANADDLSILRGLSRNVTSLDMSDLTVENGELPPLMIMDTRVVSLTLPAGIKKLADKALALTSLRTLTIPAGVTAIGDYALASNPNLTSVEVLGSPTWGKGVFRECAALATVKFTTLPAAIPDEMFYGCKKFVEMPAGASSIGNSSFEGSGLVSADLSKVSSVGERAFADIPSLKEVTLGKGAITFGKGAFIGDSGLEALPDWDGTLSEGIFINADKLENVTVNTPLIESGAFAGNTTLKHVKFGKNVENVKSDAFRKATGIIDMNAHALGDKLPAVASDAFAGLENSAGRYDIPLYVTSESIPQWKKHNVWGLFDIRDGGSGVGTGLDNASDDIKINVHRTGDAVDIISNMAIERVQIYATDGTMLYDGGDGSHTLSVEVVRGGALVVRVISGGVQKIYKLL